MPPVAAATPLLVAQSLGLERGGRELFRELSFEVLPGQLLQIDGPAVIDIEPFDPGTSSPR